MNYLLWAVFFFLNVYGHVAMKQAANEIAADGVNYFWELAKNIWSVTAVLAWITASILWMVILKRQPLMEAQSISALNYAFITLAAVAFLGESITGFKMFGIVLIAVGIYFVAK